MSTASHEAATRVHNFCAGPCTLPVSILEEVRDEFLDFDGIGMSLLEDSHRAPAYDAVHTAAMADFRTLAGVPTTTPCCSSRAAPRSNSPRSR